MFPKPWELRYFNIGKKKNEYNRTACKECFWKKFACTDNGYQYSVPENPLILSKKSQTQTVKLEVSPDNNENGYNYPIPENPLKPSKDVLIQTTETEYPSQNNEDNENGYQYPIPENPLKPGEKVKLPPQEESSQNDLKNTKKTEQIEDDEGYQYSPPENPWKLHENLPECSYEIEQEINQLISIIGIDLLGLVKHIQLVAGKCQNHILSSKGILTLEVYF